MASRIFEDKTSESGDQAVEICSISATRLKSIQQAVILAECRAIEESARNDELQHYKMAPYIEAIDSQQSSHFMIRCTRLRALLMMGKLAESINEPFPDVTERIYYGFAVNTPAIPVLCKEFGDLLVSCGLIGEAIKFYEVLLTSLAKSLDVQCGIARLFHQTAEAAEFIS